MHVHVDGSKVTHVGREPHHQYDVWLRHRPRAVITPYKVWETVSRSVCLEVLAVNDHDIMYDMPVDVSLKDDE